MAGHSVGIGIGGTFTDFSLRDQSTGRILFLKTPPVCRSRSTDDAYESSDYVEVDDVSPYDIRMKVRTTVAVSDVECG